MCQNSHSNDFFYSTLLITSQVEHTKKHNNSIDSGSKSVKQNADHQNCLTMCFYKLPYRMKTFIDLTHTVFWCLARMCDYFNRLKDSSKYSASVLQTNVTKNISSVAGRGIEMKCHTYHGNHLLHYGNHYITCFLIVPSCIGLRWFLDAVIIFLIYLSILSSI